MIQEWNKEVLESYLMDANITYHAGKSIITDSKYDEVMELLKSKYPESNLLEHGVFKRIKIERKVKLPVRMTSLDKLKSVEEVIDWINKFPENNQFVLMAKLDGISLLTAGNKCWTRGDGEVGQKSDPHYKEMQPVVFDEFTVGEAIMKNKVFSDSYLTQGFKNARNTVAGLFNSKEANIFLSDVDYVRYGLPVSKLSKLEQLSLIETEGMQVVNYIPITKDAITVELLNHYRELWSQTYKIDGLVIEVDSNELHGDYESNGNPSFAKAIKLPEWSVSAVVKVTGITTNVSKQGKIKPVIQITPTDIDGVTVCNVTGYNMNYMVDNCIAEGSVIHIVRSQDVIPKHIETRSYDINNVEKMHDDAMTCHACGEPIIWDGNFTELVCTNAKCNGIAIAKLEHFFNSLEIENFSDKGVNQLYNEGIQFIADYFLLELNDLITIEGWASSSANNLLSQLETLKTKGISLSKLLTALDIFEGKIGEKDCQIIIDNLIDNSILDWGKTSINSLTSISGIGDIKAQAFISGMNKYISEHFASLPIKISYIKTPQVEQTGKLFEGMSVCVTGFRDGMIDDFIKSQGGKMVIGVSKKTNMLIVEDMSTSSNKAAKAREYGCKIISRFEVEQMKQKNT